MTRRLAIITCMICGRYITRSFVLCERCERRYGLDRPNREWPEWARRLYADHRQAQRSETSRLAHETDSVRAQNYYERLIGGEYVEE